MLGPLEVRRRGRVLIKKRTKTTSLTVSLRGREGRLRLHRVGDSKRGDGFFGARLRVP